jgi:hypothetical protein
MPGEHIFTIKNRFGKESTKYFIYNGIIFKESEDEYIIVEIKNDLKWFFKNELKRYVSDFIDKMQAKNINQHEVVDINTEYRCYLKC